MFGFSFHRKRGKKKSWLLEFILENANHKKGQIVKVCRHICGPRFDGSVTKEVSDDSVFIRAVFTKQSVDHYNLDDELCTPPEWDQALLIVKDYSLNFLPSPTLRDCQFCLVVNKFSVLDLNNGFESKNQIHDCMEEPMVQQAAKEKWNQWIQERAMTQESEVGGQLSQLLDEVMCPMSESREESQIASTSLKLPDNLDQETVEDMLETWRRVKVSTCVGDWIIPPEQQEMLDSIEEWKEDYRPPPSLSSEESSKMESVKNPPSIQDEDASFQYIPKTNDPSKIKNWTGRKRKVASPSKSDNIETSKDTNIDTVSNRFAQTYLEKKECDKDRDTNTGKQRKGKRRKKADNNNRDVVDINIVEDEGLGKESPKNHATNVLDNTNKFNNPEEDGIKIVDVFTLEGLPNAWCLPSPESIQLTCSLGSQSQDDALTSSQSDLCDDKQQNNLSQEHEHIESQDRVANREIDTSASKKSVCEKETIVEGVPRISDQPQDSSQLKCSTPALDKRKRLESVFNKTSDTSAIPRPSTGSTSDQSEFVTCVSNDEALTKVSVNVEDSDTDKIDPLQKRVSFAPKRVQKQVVPAKSTRQSDSLYVDARSCSAHPVAHGPESPDIPQTQPFVPSTEDLMIENSDQMEDDSRNCDSSSHRVSDSFSGDVSMYHSTQRTSNPAPRPDFIISPIRTSPHSEKTESSKGLHESSDSSIVIIEETREDRKDSTGKSRKGKLSLKEKVICTDGQQYHHPSFDESGSEEQIPLSGGVNRSSRSKGYLSKEDCKDSKHRPSRHKHSEKKGAPVKSNIQNSENVIPDSSQSHDEHEFENPTRVFDSVSIEEYSSDASKPESKEDPTPSQEPQDPEGEQRYTFDTQEAIAVVQLIREKEEKEKMSTSVVILDEVTGEEREDVEQIYPQPKTRSSRRQKASSAASESEWLSKKQRGGTSKEPEKTEVSKSLLKPMTSSGKKTMQNDDTDVEKPLKLIHESVKKRLNRIAKTKSSESEGKGVESGKASNVVDKYVTTRKRGKDLKKFQEESKPKSDSETSNKEITDHQERTSSKRLEFYSKLDAVPSEQNNENIPYKDNPKRKTRNTRKDEEEDQVPSIQSKENIPEKDNPKRKTRNAGKDEEEVIVIDSQSSQPADGCTEGTEREDSEEELILTRKTRRRLKAPVPIKPLSEPYLSVKPCTSSAIMEDERGEESYTITPTAEMLLKFLNVKPLKDRRCVNFKLSEEMRNKIYSIYERPISYPGEN